MSLVARKQKIKVGPYYRLRSGENENEKLVALLLFIKELVGSSASAVVGIGWEWSNKKLPMGVAVATTACCHYRRAFDFDFLNAFCPFVEELLRNLLRNYCGGCGLKSAAVLCV